jgi:hypothetical protein
LPALESTKGLLFEYNRKYNNLIEKQLNLYFVKFGKFRAELVRPEPIKNIILVKNIYFTAFIQSSHFVMSQNLVINNPKINSHFSKIFTLFSSEYNYNNNELK